MEVVGVKLLCRRESHAGPARRPGMANKENELTCSDDARGGFCNDNRGLPVSSAEASKMAGASAKYGDFTEVGVFFCSFLFVIGEQQKLTIPFCVRCSCQRTTNQ